MNTNEVLKLALVRLQARTDTADLDAIGALNEALADHSERPLDMVAEQALDKMAENARELGLDYEPEQPAPPQTGTLDKIFLDFIKKNKNT